MGALIAVPITVGLNLLSTRPADIVTYWKWLLTYFCIEISRRRNKKRFDLYDMEVDNDPYQVAFLPPKEEVALESPFPESHLQQHADDIFCYGVNSSSEGIVVMVQRHCEEEAEACIYLRLKNGKVYQLKETSGFQHACRDVGRDFTCGALRMHYIKPMRIWRIFYNGLLKEISEDGSAPDRMVYVKFAFIWRASSDGFDMWSDSSSAALAMGIARAKWNSFTPPLEKLKRAMDFYCQAGTIMGTVTIGNEDLDRELYFFGERVRFLGETEFEGQFTHVMGQVSRNGSIIHIAEATIPHVVKNLRFGYQVLPSGEMLPISDARMNVKNSVESRNEEIEAVFYADGMSFNMRSNVIGKQSHFEFKKGWEGFVTIDLMNMKLNENKGSGVVIQGKVHELTKRRPPSSPKKEIPSRIPLAVSFSNEVCQVQDATGGKGSSLGKLTHLSKALQSFIVPNGIVVTTSAYKEFLNKETMKKIKNLEDVLYGNKEGDVKEACQSVMDEVIKANFPDQVLQSVVKELHNAFGDNLYSKKFAVRSSATGEDTEQMSAAGQMETYLGVTGLNEIVSAVKKCWASQFGFIAVQYKRQNGQVLNSPMAVVIQEMISCDVAGVLFTCDPLTGNPTLMSITANYGLGESVVSGSEEPDTIVVERDADNNLVIKEKIIGAKSHRIVVKDDEGTSVEEVSENEKRSCCLSDVLALRLGTIAVQIEKKYRSSRDIEWGYWNNNLYIFQSRPVTSGSGETDFEIDHERDGPMRIENEYFTVCNVGEVMPGAMSPLGMDVLMKFFAIPFMRKSISAWQSQLRPRYYPKGIVPMFYHIMFYNIDLLEHVSEGKTVIKASMIGLFGREIEDEDLYQIAWERYGSRKKRNFFAKNFALIKSLYGVGDKLKKAQKSYAGYHLQVEKLKTSREMFDLLLFSCTDITESFQCHMLSSQASTIWNMMVLNIFGQIKGGINAEVYSIFAKLLAAINEVESADVPSAMQSLAYHIGKEVKQEDFKKMDCNEIKQWLNTSPSSAGIKYREFLNKHGHRCLKEFDIRSSTWGEKPEHLIEMLKNMVGNVKEESLEKKTIDLNKLLSELDIPLSFSQRLMLKFLLPWCRKAVMLRETTKSLLIKILHDWRKGYRLLAKTMVSEGRIPEEDLFYFITLEEIQELMDTRSPKILSRAAHRRKRYPKLDGYIFPEIMKGFPKPINEEKFEIIPTDKHFMMKGIPVSQGVAKGFVRVALNLEEASHLKAGEILLTYSTDIGWTPYFPTLAGVVTELGGLISHGAVVSREYGIPCIAGLHGATRQFQTGDYVLLDGNRGILQKLPPPE